MNRTITLTLLLILTLTLLPPAAEPATVYIDPDCAHNGDGTDAACASSSGGIGAHNTLIGLSPVRGNTYQLEGSTIHYGGWTIDTAESGTETIRITSRTGRAAITSRVRTATTGWSESGGVYSKDIGVSYIRVFWAALSGWGEEIPQDTSTPTSPADGKWGVDGTTIYYNPSVSQAVPGTAGAVFEYSASSPANTSGQILVGLLITTGYVEVDNIQATRSAQEGIFAGSGSAALHGISLTRTLTDYNGNFTSPDPDQRIGNGIEFGVGVVGAVASDGESAYNFDHGVAVESIGGAAKPTGVIVRKMHLHDNGSCGGTIRGSIGNPAHAYYLDNLIENNGAAHGETYPTNGESGIKMYFGHGTMLWNRFLNNGGAAVYAPAATYDADGNGAVTVIGYNLMAGNGANNNYLDHSSYDDGAVSLISDYANLSGAGAIGSVAMYNNTMIGNGAYAGYWSHNGTHYGDLVMKNNIIRGSGRYDVLMSAINAGSTLEFDKNIYDAEISGYAPIRVNFTNYQAANLAAWNGLSFVGDDAMSDPLFVSATDYHLTADSPAVDAGAAISGVTCDREHRAVPFGAAPDIGAYEYRQKTCGVR